jgi:hypothetical protein
MTREEAIEMLKKDKEQRGNCFISDALDMAIKALEQKPKIGHWITTSDYLTTAYGSVDYVKCSCCDEYSLEEGYYCPNCGAKMEDE